MARLRAGLAAFVLVAAGCTWTTKAVVPELPENAQSSKLFAADGSLITILHAEENRESLPLTKMSTALQDAVVAIEDERFWLHNGVDLQAVLRAARTNAEAGSVTQGGSTITQQYVKNALIGSDRTIDRKVQEAALALQLERKYTKERILELYLNTIYFGSGAYGAEAASREFFGKSAAADADDPLTAAEAALLAGMIQSPSRTDPFDVPEAALDRRDIVLAQMLDLGYLDHDGYEAAAAEALALRPAEVVESDDRYEAAHFVEDVKQWFLDNPEFGPTRAEREQLLFAGGLRIHTTVDLDMQRQAEQAVAQILPDPDTFPQAAVAAVEPGTGFVRAMVGGRDYFGPGDAAKFNLAAHKGRPTGSSFKPFVLAAAIEEGIPVTEVYPAPGTIEIQVNEDEIWRPSNYGGGGGGDVTLVTATIRSYNTVYAQLIMDVGPTDAVDTARRLGVTNELAAFPSAVLGANDITPLDMADAYATFANRGVQVPPAMVTKIVRPDGTTFYEHAHRQTKAIETETADQVTDILRKVVEAGTGTRARLGRPAAGKTGTGQDNTDAWFVGYTPGLATAVWVGFQGESRPMQPPTTSISVTGGSWPAQIWQLFMSAALAEVAVAPFPAPPTSTTTTTPEGDAAVEDDGDVIVVPVAGVVGDPAGPAEAELRAQGLQVRRVTVADESTPAGRVVAQSPPTGAFVRPGTTVVIEISNGEASASKVPDVVGKTENKASAAVEGDGFTVELVFEAEPDGEVKKNRVWKQDPSAGAFAPAGSTVRLWVVPSGDDDDGG